MEKCNLLHVNELLGVNVSMRARLTVLGLIFLIRGNRSFRRKKPKHAINFYVLLGVRITCF